MRYKTLLFLFFTFCAIGIINAKRSSSSRYHGSRGSNSHGSRGSNSHGSHGSNSHGSTSSHTSSGNSHHRQDTIANTNFLNAERGGATPGTSQTGHYDKPGTVTESKQSASPYAPSAPTATVLSQGGLPSGSGSWSNPHFDSNQPYNPSQSHHSSNNSPGSNQPNNRPNYSRHSYPVNHPRHPNSNQTHPRYPNSNQTHPRYPNSNQTHPRYPNSNQTHPLYPNSNQTHPRYPNSNQTHPVSNPQLGFKQRNMTSQTSPSLHYPSTTPNYPVHQPNSMPMGNPYNLQSFGNNHATGPAYTPPPQMFAQPAMQPFVPGQTMIIMQPSNDNGRGIGDMVKEALVYSTVHETVHRLFNSFQTHNVESKPSSAPTNITTITYNNYYNTSSGTTDTSSTVQRTVNGGMGTVSAGNISTRNITTGQTNSPASPNINNNARYKISDNEIFTITESLFAMSHDLSKYIKLNLQKQSTSSNVMDEARWPLFQVDPAVLEYPSIYITHTLYDKYEHDFRKKINRTQETREHENLLIDTYLNTNVMASAMQWLGDQGFIDSDDFERKDVLRRIWFTTFSGSTCGFERVFESENYGSEIIGIQDWLYFANRESSRRINYMGYTNQLKLGNTASLLKLNFEMDGIVRPNSTIFVGTTPELEMALYTICFYVRSNDLCPISLGGTRFNIYTHSFFYFGNLVLDLGIPMF